MFFKNSLNTRMIKGLTPLNIARSDYPKDVTEEEKSSLIKNQIQTIIDLRSPLEILKKPNPFERDSRFSLFYCSMPGGEKLPRSEGEISFGYFKLARNKASITNILLKILKSDGGALIHCTAGKDRTGVVAAVLQLIMGVSQEQIIEDYQVSYENIKSLVEVYKREHQEVPAYAGLSKPEYMEEFLSLFFHKYRTVDQYLLKLGLSRLQVAKLRKKLSKA